MQQPDLGRRIADLRKNRRLTQEELAAMCNINVRTLQRIESGAVIPRDYTVRVISAVLGNELNGSDRKPYFKRVHEGVQDLFNLKTQKMAKISFLSTVLLSTGLSVLLFCTEAKAQNQNQNQTAVQEIKTKGLIIKNDGYFGIDTDPAKEYWTASGMPYSDGSASLTFRGDKFELTSGNLVYLNNVYFATVEPGDTVMLPWKKGEQWVIRQHSPVKFPSLRSNDITYIAPKYPREQGNDDFKATYTFENGIKLKEEGGVLYMNGERLFDLRDGDTVVLDHNWKAERQKGRKPSKWEFKPSEEMLRNIQFSSEEAK